ncbi:MAG: hypothetical protein R2795_07305 [Saprospiraceae bacterium]
MTATTATPAVGCANGGWMSCPVLNVPQRGYVTSASPGTPVLYRLIIEQAPLQAPSQSTPGHYLKAEIRLRQQCRADDSTP